MSSIVELAIDVILPVFVLVSLWFLFKMCRSLESRSLRFRLRGCRYKHNWKEWASDATFQTRCSSCDHLLVTATQSFFCDCCGICADSGCVRLVNDSYICKGVTCEKSELSTPLAGSSVVAVKHQYIDGNLPESSNCEICGAECTGNSGLKCVWCHRTVHKTCRTMLGDVCDMGKLKRFVISPNSVKVTQRRERRMGRVKKTFKFESPGSLSFTWTPVFVIANRKSGNSTGGVVLSAFRHVLNPVQVIDLSQKDPTYLSRLLSTLPEAARPIVFIAGGDGTIAWVLSTLSATLSERSIPCGIIPLGTGNDLSRSLGWGAEEIHPFTPTPYLDRARDALPRLLDQWSIVVKQPPPRIPLARFGMAYANRPKMMYNYMSVGVDALVTWDFHEARSSRFYVYSNRLFNKIIYFLFGTQQVVTDECAGLEQRLELYLDGQRVELPEIQSVVILNIPCWGSGVKLWQLVTANSPNVSPQRIDDGKLEVVGLFSSFHVAQLQLGLSEPHLIGQASTVKMLLKTRSPIQVDGEPWIQDSCCIEINRCGQVTVLEPSTPPS